LREKTNLLEEAAFFGLNIEVDCKEEAEFGYETTK
jgi:hypothetical protein